MFHRHYMHSDVCKRVISSTTLYYATRPRKEVAILYWFYTITWLSSGLRYHHARSRIVDT